MMARAFHSPLIWNTQDCAQYFIFIKIKKKEHVPWLEKAIAYGEQDPPLIKLESGEQDKGNHIFVSFHLFRDQVLYIRINSSKS